MRLKLPATNLTYVILCVKYTLDGKELACNMHMVNDNKQEDVEIDTPDGAVVTTVTLNEVTNAQKVVSIQVLYDSTEDEDKSEDKSEDTNSNLKVETQVEVKIERKEHGQTSRTSRGQESKSGKGERSKGKEKS